jgi:hypothetical protein
VWVWYFLLILWWQMNWLFTDTGYSDICCQNVHFGQSL